MTKRRRETWTFQPADDVAIAVNAILGENASRGQRSQFINEALRFSNPGIAMITAEMEVYEATARLERMKKMLAKLKGASSAEKAAILSAADSKIRDAHEAAQPNGQATRHVRKHPPKKAP